MAPKADQGISVFRSRSLSSPTAASGMMRLCRAAESAAAVVSTDAREIFHHGLLRGKGDRARRVHEGDFAVGAGTPLAARLSAQVRTAS